MTPDQLDEIHTIRVNIRKQRRICDEKEIKLDRAKLEKKYADINVSDERIERLGGELDAALHDLATMCRELAEIDGTFDTEEEDAQKVIREMVIAKPPFLAEAITRLVTKPTLRDRVLGSREERFHRDLRDRSKFQAQAVYWCDTIASCWPGIKRLGLWLLTGDAIRRWFGS